MKQIVFMGGILLLYVAIIALPIYYVAKRMAWSFGSSTGVLSLILGALTCLFIVTLMTIMRTNPTSGLSHILYNIATIGLGVFLMWALSTIAVDLVHWVVKFSPRAFGWSVLTLTAGLSLYALWNAQHTRIIEREIVLPNLEQPLRIAHLTDIHIGHFWGEKTVERLVEQVAKEQVDAVVITGDLFDGRVRLRPEVLTPFQQLDVPIYFVEGNHDGYTGSGEIKAMLRDYGIQVLDNKLVSLKGTQIIGLDYSLPDRESVDVFHAPASRYTMQELLPALQIDPNKASILLHHNPVGVNHAADNGINLYLAGHTHAGQIFPATIIASWMFPYNKGLYRVNDTTQVYVSQGTGTFGPPMRLGTQSEIAILNLKRK